MDGLLLMVHDRVDVGTNRPDESVQSLQLRRPRPVPVRKLSSLLGAPAHETTASGRAAPTRWTVMVDSCRLLRRPRRRLRMETLGPDQAAGLVEYGAARGITC
jgi:hypothetical protein